MDTQLLNKIMMKRSIYPAGSDFSCLCEDIIRTSKILILYGVNKDTGKKSYFWMTDPVSEKITTNFTLDRCHHCMIGSVGRTEDGILFGNNIKYYGKANTLCTVFKRLK